MTYYTSCVILSDMDLSLQALAAYLPDQQMLCLWLQQWGSIALFVLLALGILALPVPEETLMVLAGVLMDKGQLPVVQTVGAAYLGSMTGITMSYILGKTVGRYFISKYGGWIGFTEKRMEAAHRWFARYGKWSLFFGYFIPGVRHFTGLVAGMTSLKFAHFTLFAYCGAFLWASTFLAIGYFVHSYWFAIFELIETGIEDLVITLVLITLFYLFFKIKRR